MSGFISVGSKLRLEEETNTCILLFERPTEVKGPYPPSRRRQRP